MHFKPKKGVSDKMLRLLKANRELLVLRKEQTALQGQMVKALTQEVLKDYQWKGPVWSDTIQTRVYEPGEMHALADTNCPKSPLGLHVTPAVQAGTHGGSIQVSFKCICFCCGEQLQDDRQLGWVTSQERKDHADLRLEAKRHGFTNIKEYMEHEAERAKEAISKISKLSPEEAIGTISHYEGLFKPGSEVLEYLHKQIEGVHHA
jgi:hypothetical protein